MKAIIVMMLLSVSTGCLAQIGFDPVLESQLNTEMQMRQMQSDISELQWQAETASVGESE